MLAWPVGFLGILNRNNLPQHVYDVVLEQNRRLRPDLFGTAKPDADAAEAGTAAAAAAEAIDGPVPLPAGTVALPTVDSAGAAAAAAADAADAYQPMPFVDNPPDGGPLGQLPADNTTSGTIAVLPPVPATRL